MTTQNENRYHRILLLAYAHLLRSERQAAGFSVKQLADRFQLSPDALERWESGDSSPPASVFMQLMGAFGPESLRRAAELNWLFQLHRGTTSPPPPR